MPSITVFADGATAVNDAAVGTIDWTNLTNVGANDNNNAFFFSSPAGTSKYLRAAPNSLAAIPAGSTIDGIVVTVGLSENALGNDIFDNSVRLYKSGTGFVGDNKSSGTEWPTSETARAYGTSSDLWGTTWTRDEVVNDLEFGISVVSAAGGWQPNIDYIQFTIHYTEPFVPKSFSDAGAEGAESFSKVIALTPDFTDAGAEGAEVFTVAKLKVFTDAGAEGSESFHLTKHKDFTDAGPEGSESFSKTRLVNPVYLKDRFEAILVKIIE